jgi:zinc/manganese transport system substrate-binding protein
MYIVLMHRLLLTMFLLGWWFAMSVTAAPLRVASLHPVISDIARQVGGDEVEVIELMPLDSNPHHFYPTPATLKAAASADLVLAAGKGLEFYLDDFRESLGAEVPVMEVGQSVPSLRVEADDVFVCCPTHAQGAIDPHWWHSIKNARRAAAALADRFTALRPEQEALFDARYRAYADQLDDLYRWARRQIGSIPRADREVTTAHAAFGYLCRELGLRSIMVLGLTQETDADPGYLKDVIATLREHQVRAVFPEDNANPKVLESLAREAGVRIGGQLYGDMLDAANPTYESMMRYNITTLVEGLRGVE